MSENHAEETINELVEQMIMQGLLRPIVIRLADPKGLKSSYDAIFKQIIAMRDAYLLSMGEHQLSRDQVLSSCENFSKSFFRLFKSVGNTIRVAHPGDELTLEFLNEIIEMSVDGESIKAVIDQFVDYFFQMDAEGEMFRQLIAQLSDAE